MKKIMLWLLTTGMIFSIIGCSSTKNTKSVANNTHEIRLKWIMPGPGEQKDSPKVWAEFNKQLKTIKGLENITVDFSVIPSSDYKQKFLLLRAGGESIDIAQTYTLDFVNEVRAGTFIQIEDLIERNAPNIKKSMPDYMWNYGMVDSKLYLVPNYQQMSSPIYGLRTPTKLAEKYLDAKKMEQVFFSEQTLTKESYNVIEEYLAKLKANGLIGLGFNSIGLQVAKGYESITSSYRYKINSDRIIVEDVYNTEEYKLCIETMANWYKKGYIRKDVLSAKREDDNGKENGNAIWFDQTWKGAKENDAKKYGMDITVVPMQDYYFIPYTAPAGGNAIMSKCVNPDAAIKLLELMNSESGKDLYNLLVYGIEGEHYTKIGEDKIQTLDYTGGATSSAKYGLWKWVVGNARMAYDTQSDAEGWKNYIFNEINEGKDTVKSKLLGFTPNLKPIETKLAQVNTVATEYSNVLVSGSLAEYEQHYKSFQEKLEKAGNTEVLNELQRQVDEFIAKKK